MVNKSTYNGKIHLLQLLPHLHDIRRQKPESGSVLQWDLMYQKKKYGNKNMERKKS